MEDEYAIPQKRNKWKNKTRNPYKRGGRNRIKSMKNKSLSTSKSNKSES